MKILSPAALSVFSFFAISYPSLPAIAAGGVIPIQEVFAPAPRDPKLWDRVAVVQSAPSQAAKVGISIQEAMQIKARNWDELETHIRHAASQGAKLIITSEFGTIGYPDTPGVPPEDQEFQSREEIAPYVETVPGPTTAHFGGIAKSLGVYLQVGMAEVDPSTGKYYNTAVVIDSSGRLVTHYRKITLFQQETRFLSPGDRTVAFDSPWGRIGIVVCADIYASAVLNSLAGQGVETLTLSTSWDEYNTGFGNFANTAKTRHWYVLAANQPYFPDSGVIEPTGVPQSHIRQTDGIAYGYLPRRTSAYLPRRTTRKTLPF